MVAVFILMLVPFALGQQESNPAGCQALIQCMQSVETSRIQCDQQRQAILGAQKKQSSSNDPCSTITDKMEQLQQLYIQQRQQLLACLESRLSNAFLEGGKKQQDKCQVAIQNQLSQSSVSTSSSSSSISGSSNVNTQKRQKRQQHQMGAGEEEGMEANGNATGGHHHHHHGNATHGNETHGNHTHHGNETHHERERENGGNMTHHGNVTHSKESKEKHANATIGKASLSELKQCYYKLAAQQELCKPLFGCCSEVNPCDDQFHLSQGTSPTLHNQIYQARVELDKLRRNCQGQKSKGNQAQPTATGGGGVHANIGTGGKQGGK